MIRQLRHFLGTLRQLCLTNSSSSVGQWSSCHLSTSLTDTGRSSILSGTCNGATCLGVRTCLPYFLPWQRKADYYLKVDKICSPLATGTSKMGVGIHLQDPEARVVIIKDGHIEQSLIGCIFSWYMWGARVLFQIFKEKKCYWKVCGSFNIRRNSIFSSCFTLLGFFLSAKS